MRTLHLDGRKDPFRRESVEDGRWEVVTANGDHCRPVAFRKTTLTYATRIPVPFQVETLEGLHFGKAGDYLAIGAHGEMYPIDAAVMADTYEPA